MTKVVPGVGLAMALTGLVAGGTVGSPVGSPVVRAPPGETATSGAQVFALDDEVRLRREDSGRARAEGRPLTPAGGPDNLVDLVAWRGETVAFQIVVLAAAAPLATVAISLSGLAAGGGASPRVEIFREHYLPVRARSRNDRRPAESLGWLPGARPTDDEMLGDLPDALLPLDLDPGPVVAGPAVPARQTGAHWIDVDVPESTPAGSYLATGAVRGDGVLLARFTLRVQVLAAPLPYRATSVFAFYEAERLDRRIGAAGAVERQLWRLLHAHHIDALAPLGSGADVRRLTAVYDGSLFTPAPRQGDGDGEADGAGYQGPGTGTPPAVVALGAYGILGAPRPEALARVDDMLAALDGLPASTARGGTADVFLYAIDETCASPRAGDWRRALAGRWPHRTLLVGQTCGDPPERQAADIVMATPEAFPRALPAAARAVGRRAWIYNGSLPHAGTLLLDADPRGLMANGWIAAVMDIQRWFYWEAIFWDDDNRGGHGPVDPFTTPEGFHNRDGDAALGDGLLLYPGRQRAPFAARSLGYDGVLPSLRLKFIRRGIEDAGIVALAAREHPLETARLIAQALPAALDEAPPDRPAAWQGAPLRFAAARAALRRLVTRADAMTPAEISVVFADQAQRRRQLVPLAVKKGRPAAGRRSVILIGILALIAAVMLLVIAGRRSRAQGVPPGAR